MRLKENLLNGSGLEKNLGISEEDLKEVERSSLSQFEKDIDLVLKQKTPIEVFIKCSSGWKKLKGAPFSGIEYQRAGPSSISLMVEMKNQRSEGYTIYADSSNYYGLVRGLGRKEPEAIYFCEKNQNKEIIRSKVFMTPDG